MMAGNALIGAAEAALARWLDEERPAVGTYTYHAPPTEDLDPVTGHGTGAYALAYLALGVEVEVDLESLRVETIESGESQRPDLPTCGYLVTHKEKGVSFLHTGDLTEPYPALEALRGRVDFFCT